MAQLVKMMAQAVEDANIVKQLRKQNRDLVAAVNKLLLSNKQALAREIEQEISKREARSCKRSRRGAAT